MIPDRITQQRIKNWQPPINSIKVGRGTIWATPFKVVGTMIYGDTPGRNRLLGSYVCIESCSSNAEAQLRAQELYGKWVDKKLDYLHLKPCLFTKEDIRFKLKGKHLVCGCKYADMCHADVLIRLANK